MTSAEEETEEEKAAKAMQEAIKAFAGQMQAAAEDIAGEDDADQVIEKIKSYMDEADDGLEQYGPDGKETVEKYRKEIIAAGLNSAVRQENTYRVSGSLNNVLGALKIYEALGDHTDNAESAAQSFLDSVFGDAAKAMQNGKYNKAEKIYAYLYGLGCDGAEDGLKNAAYQKALKVMEAGNLLEAAEMFDDLIGYKDAEAAAAECRNHYSTSINAAANAESGIAVSWPTIEEADGYFLTMDGSVTVDLGPESYSYTFTEANTNGKEYSFTVAPYFIDEEGNKDKGGESPVFTWTFLEKMQMQNLTSNRAGEVTVTWAPNEYSGYYEVAYGLSPELTSAVVIIYMADQPTTQTIDGLVPATYYYFKVRSAVQGMDNKIYYSVWSDTVPIIVRDYAAYY